MFKNLTFEKIKGFEPEAIADLAILIVVIVAIIYFVRNKKKKKKDQ